MPCRVLCAYSEGTVGFSMPDIDLMLTVRMDETFEILKASAEANQEFQKSLPQEYADAVIETRWREAQKIQVVEGNSPSGLILKEPFWIFKEGSDRDEVIAWFGENHSKGKDYLAGLT